VVVAMPGTDKWELQHGQVKTRASSTYCAPSAESKDHKNGIRQSGAHPLLLASHAILLLQRSFHLKAHTHFKCLVQPISPSKEAGRRNFESCSMKKHQ